MAQRALKRSKQAPFVVTIALAAAASACGGNVDGGAAGATGGSSGFGGSGGGTVNPPPPSLCPEQQPTSGDPCASVGAQCPYPGYVNECNQQIDYLASCGPDLKWTIGTTGVGASCNPPPPPVDVCPQLEPVVGQWCNVVESKYCSYPGMCCGADYQCVGSTWQQVPISCNPPYVECPADPPADGEACQPCGYATCTYGDCSTGETQATCSDGAWSVTVTMCAP